jgi:PPOX class probable F420-dependent enzyme
MDESDARHADGADGGVQLPVECLDLLDRPLLAVVATVGPGGAPHATPVWVLRRGAAVVFNTTNGRAKAQNLGREPRVALCVLDDQDPYRYLQVQGRAHLSTAGARSTIDTLAHLYTGAPFRPLEPGEERVDVTVDVHYVDYHPVMDVSQAVRIGRPPP